MFWCNHKLGEIKNGYQYCEKCGKAFVVPPIPCTHKWELLSTNKMDYSTSVTYVNRCTKCGELKQHKYDLMEDF